MLRQDANTIYDQWVTAGHACDVNWGEMVEVMGWTFSDSENLVFVITVKIMRFLTTDKELEDSQTSKL